MIKMDKKRIWATVGGAAVAVALAGGAFYMANQSKTPATNTITAQSSQEVGQSTGQYQVETREISYESNGNRIYGVARIPQGAGRMPTVVFAHGFGGNHDQELTIQETLAANGIAVYAIDFAGGTGYSPGQSEGEMTDMSVLTEQADLEGALATVREQDFADINNIFLIGASQGGVVSTLTALANSADIQGLALLYPAFSLFDDARQRFGSENAIPDTYNLMGLTVGRRYFEEAWNIDIFDEMSNFDKPVTIFHGTADDIVPYSYAERASQTFPDASLTTVENAGHGFSNSEQSQIASQLVDFINTNKKN